MNKGSWAFLIGLVVAIVLAFASESTRFLEGNMLVLILVVIGLIVGFLNFSAGAEVLLAYVALLVVAIFTFNHLVTANFSVEVSNIALFIAAVVIVMAVRMILFESGEETATTPVTKPSKTGKRVA